MDKSRTPNKNGRREDPRRLQKRSENSSNQLDLNSSSQQSGFVPLTPVLALLTPVLAARTPVYPLKSPVRTPSSSRQLISWYEADCIKKLKRYKYPHERYTNNRDVFADLYVQLKQMNAADVNETFLKNCCDLIKELLYQTNGLVEERGNIKGQCAEKEKRVQDLKHRLQEAFKELESKVAENNGLTRKLSMEKYNCDDIRENLKAANIAKENAEAEVAELQHLVAEFQHRVAELERQHQNTLAENKQLMNDMKQHLENVSKELESRVAENERLQKRAAIDFDNEGENPVKKSRIENSLLSSNIVENIQQPQSLESFHRDSPLEAAEQQDFDQQIPDLVDPESIEGLKNITNGMLTPHPVGLERFKANFPWMKLFLGRINSHHRRL